MTKFDALSDPNKATPEHRLPVALAAGGGLLIALSFIWQMIVPAQRMITEEQLQRINEAKSAGHRIAPLDSVDGADSDGGAVPADGAEAVDGAGTEDGPPGASAAEDRDASTGMAPEDVAAMEDATDHLPEVQRVSFLYHQMPLVLRILGVLLAAAGSILYPIQLLRRQKEDSEDVEVI